MSWYRKDVKVLERLILCVVIMSLLKLFIVKPTKYVVNCEFLDRSILNFASYAELCDASVVRFLRSS